MVATASFLYGEEYFKIAFASIGYVGRLPTFICLVCLCDLPDG